MNLLERNIPSPIDQDEKWTPWVAKRWVTGTLTRLFSRYTIFNSFQDKFVVLLSL
jgi:hypothetical protein